MSSPFQNRWYQEEAEFSIFDYFQRGGRGNPVVALPTGTGKSVVIGNFVRHVFERWPTQRLIKLTHDKKLIEQNAKKLIQMWPVAPLGIYSAGLKQRDGFMPVLFGGVQSVAKAMKRGESFGHRDLLLIDECHLLSPNEDTMYMYVIGELLKINPYMKVVGFSATPYRLRMGLITEGGIFTDICYDLTDIEGFNRLLAEGFLAPLIPKRTGVEIDVSEVGMSNGDYANKQLEEASDKITYEACREMCEWGHNRACWLVFAAGIKHAENIAAVLNSFGVSAAAVHSKLSEAENDKRIEAFKRGELRCLVNNGMLTTGFDHPPIDLIAMLRATMSPGLWVQMLGRGTRPYGPGKSDYIPNFNYDKQDCLVLDYAGNGKRLGPINDPVIPKKPGAKGGSDAPIRICDCCNTYNHASARFCIVCGTEFKFETKIFGSAGTVELIRSDLPQVETVPVSRVIYNLHEKEGSKPMIKVSYFCGFNMYNEFICLEHGGFAGKKARDWWRQRHREEPPETTCEALRRVSELRMPARLRVWINKKYPEVLGYEF